MLGIVVAMEAEASPLLKNGTSEEKVIFGKRFITVETEGKKAVVVISGIGKVNAAFATTLLIENFHPDAIMNFGVSGSLAKEYGHLDLIAATGAVQHDCDTSALGDPKGLVSTVNKIYFEADEELTDALCKISGAKKAVVACGDQFVADRERKEFIRESFRAAVCDMESGAVAHCAYLAGIRFLCLRCVSDMGSDSAAEEYGDFLPRAAGKLCSVVSEFIKTAAC